MMEKEIFLLITANLDGTSNPNIVEVPRESLIGIWPSEDVASSGFVSNQNAQKFNSKTPSESFVATAPERKRISSNDEILVKPTTGCINTNTKSVTSKKTRKTNLCTICQKLFPSSTKLRYHLLTVHSDERPYSCPVCSKSFKLLFRVKHHMVVHLNEKGKQMEELPNVSFLSQPTVISVPEPKVSAIASKAKSLDSTSSKSSATLGSVINGWHYCSFCRKGFPGRSKLVKHLKSHTDEKIFQPSLHKNGNRIEKQLIKVHPCTVCQKLFSTKTKLDLHLAIHSDRRPFVCHMCSKSFKVLQQLKNHVKLIHTGEFKCEECQIQFKSKKRLVEHQKLHEGPVGDICEKLYRNKKYLQNLKEAHLKHSCNQCSMNFKHKQEFKQHLIEIHKELKRIVKNHVCTVCGLSFQFNCQLKYHMVVHDKSSTNKFVCDACGIILSTRNSFLQHKMRHAGIKPFQCDVCGKAFITRARLKLHARTHTGERPYTCEVCKKTFTQRTTLVIHMRLHRGERPNTCEICQKGFVSRRMMTTHKKKKHQLN